jgi:hypothetical protein
MNLSCLKIRSLDTETLILPFVEKETTSDSFDALDMVSFLESWNTLNLASPNTLPASLEYVTIGAGMILNNFSAFLLNRSNLDKVSASVDWA